MTTTVFILAEEPYAQSMALALSAGTPDAEDLRVLVGTWADVDRARLKAAQPQVVVVADEHADGVALARAVREELAPDSRVIVVGGPGTAIKSALDLAALGGVRFLRRPVDPGALRFAVTSSLRERLVPRPAPPLLGASPGGVAHALGVRTIHPQPSGPVNRALDAFIDAAVSEAISSRMTELLSGALDDMGPGPAAVTSDVAADVWTPVRTEVLAGAKPEPALIDGNRSTGANPAAVRTTGSHAVVTPRTTGSHVAVKPTRLTGSHAAVTPARSTGSHAVATPTTGSHPAAPPARTTGTQPAATRPSGSYGAAQRVGGTDPGERKLPPPLPPKRSTSPGFAAATPQAGATLPPDAPTPPPMPAMPSADTVAATSAPDQGLLPPSSAPADRGGKAFKTGPTLIVARTPAPETPHWREPTQVLKQSVAATDGGARETGTFARELRRTISQIEQRLFPNEQGAPHEASEDVTHSDIDLDALGVDTVPGLIDDELGRMHDAIDLAAVPAPDDEATGAFFPGDVERSARGLGALAESAPGSSWGGASGPIGMGGTPGPSRAGGGTPGPVRASTPARGTGLTPGPLAFAGSSTPVPTESGQVAEEDAAFLIARLHRIRFTGRVSFRRDEGEKVLFFDDGRPVFALSNAPHDRMGELLCREGKITHEQLERAQTLVNDSGRRVGEILVDMGFLKPRELFPAVRRHIEDIVYSLFAWVEGEWMISPTSAVPGERIRLSVHPAALVLEGVRRKVGRRRLAAKVGGVGAVVEVQNQTEGGAPAVDADLASEERKAFELLDGVRTLAEVAQKSGLGEVALAQLAYALIALGLAKIKNLVGEELARGDASLAPVSRETDVAIDRQRVRAKYAHVVEGDYFSILGLRQDATAFEVRRAYESARREYAKDSLAAELSQELTVELDEIGVVIEEAYRVLHDDRIRAAYLGNLRAS